VEAVLHGGSFTGRAGATSNGIYNTDSGTTLEATGITALGENGNSYNYGLNNTGGAGAVLYSGSFTARGGDNIAYGIYNYHSSTTLEATGVTVLAENGGTDNYGLYNYTATAEVDSSRLTGGTCGLYMLSGTVHLGVSQLDGGATHTAGTLTCFQVYDGIYSAYACP
jgi:hypothetical protein